MPFPNIFENECSILKGGFAGGLGLGCLGGCVWWRFANATHLISLAKNGILLDFLLFFSWMQAGRVTLFRRFDRCEARVLT